MLARRMSDDTAGVTYVATLVSPPRSQRKGLAARFSPQLPHPTRTPLIGKNNVGEEG